MPLRGPAWATGPTTGGSPLPCGRRPPFAATAPSADAVGRYQRRDLPRSMVSFTKRGSRSRTDPPVTKARLAHTHIHTHAHKYTYKYIDIHIHRQTECRGAPVRCVLLQRPFPAYFSMRLPHIHNTPQDRLLQSPHTPTRTHTRTHIPPGFFGRRRPQGPNELKPCFLRWGTDPLQRACFSMKPRL